MAAPPYTMGQSPRASMVEQLKVARLQLAAAQGQLASAQAQVWAAQQQAQQREQQPAQQLEEPAENNLQELESDESDAADFILYNSKYHDCFLTVGNPESDKIEMIGAASLYLIANSPVFRMMLGSYKQTDLPNAKIIVSDVSPATFKLMLRHLYGGELPKMTAIETAGLALCADKYKITRLVQETLKRLKPTSAEDVFPALICVTYTRFPDLEVQVTNIIQRETDKVVQSDDFLQLEEACVLFILKQDTLNIDEVELWKHVVRWAEHQVEINPARTVRDCLAKILRYVRFLTFTSEEILDHVLPTEAVTSEEYVDLSRAVRKKEPLKSSLLCNVQEKRNVYQKEEVNAESTLGETENKTEDGVSVLQNMSETMSCKRKNVSGLTENQPESIVFNKSCVYESSSYFDFQLANALNKFSSLTIMPSKPMEIVSFTCKSRSGQPNEEYKYNCFITITKFEMNKFMHNYTEDVSVEGSALCNVEIVLPLKFNSGQPIVMNPGERWEFQLKWDDSYPVNVFIHVPNVEVSYISLNPIVDKDMIVFYGNPFHVVEIAYKTQ